MTNDQTSSLSKRPQFVRLAIIAVAIGMITGIFMYASGHISDAGIVSTGSDLATEDTFIISSNVDDTIIISEIRVPPSRYQIRTPDGKDQ